MRKGKRTLAGVAAGALGLALIPFVGVGVASAGPVNGGGASATSPYLVGTDAIVQRGNTAPVVDSYTAARVQVSSGSVGVFGRIFNSSTSTYATNGGWNTTTGTVAFGLGTNASPSIAPTSANAADFVALTAPAAATAVVTLWQDSNSNGQIDIGENVGNPQTVTFNAVSSVTVDVVPAASPVTAGESTTFTVTPKVGADALNQDDDNTAIAATTAVNWSVGAFYTAVGATTATAVTPVNNAASVTSPSISVGSTAGTIPITGFVDPTGATAAVTAVPTGAASGTGSIVVSSQVPTVSNSTLVATGTGVVGGATASVTIPQTTTSVVWTATIKDAATTPQPIANAATVLTLTNTSAGAVTFKINGGNNVVVNAAATTTATVNTSSAGQAAFTVEVVSPVTAGAVTAGTKYEAQVTSAAGKTIALPATAPTATYTAAGTVSFTESSATAAGVTGGTVVSVGASSAVAPGSQTGATAMTLPIAATGATTVPLSITVKDTLGNPIANKNVYVWTAAPAATAATLTATTAAASATVTTNSSGVATFTVSSAPANNDKQQIIVSTATLPAGAPTNTDAIGFWQITYATAATVTPASITATANVTGKAVYPATATAVTTAADINQITFAVKNAAGSSVGSGVPVTVTAPAGALVKSGAAGNSNVSTYSPSITVLTSSGDVVVSVISTKSGAQAVSASSTVTGSGSVTFVPLAASSATIAPTAGGAVPASVPADSVTSMTATITDANGNGIGLSDVQVTIAGDATFAANGAKTLVGTTSTAGTLAFDVRAGASGSFTVTATQSATVAATTPSITIGAAAKSIAIAAYRSGGTVVVDGDAVGFARGDTVNIRVKFYNANKKKYSSWRGAGTALVKSGGSFSGFIATDRQVKVKVNGGGTVSNIETVK